MLYIHPGHTHVGVFMLPIYNAADVFFFEKKMLIATHYVDFTATSCILKNSGLRERGAWLCVGAGRNRENHHP